MTNSLAHWAALVFLVFASALGSSATSAARERTDQLRINRLIGELDMLRLENSVAALGIVLIRNDQISVLEVRGLANREELTPIGEDAIFRIGSISKMFAGLAAAQLDASERLSLNSPISSWHLEGTFSNRWETNSPMTVAQLLEHTAGLEDLSKPEWDFSDPSQPALARTLRLYPQARQAQWQPGLHHSYSNAGAGLAGYVMEQASGQTWEVLLQQMIFNRLGMTDTSVLKPVGRRLAQGYDTDGTTAIPYWYQIFRPFAAINSTLQDMGQFIRMLINRGTLDRQPVFQTTVIDRLEKPTTSLAARRGLDFGYGLGNYQWQRKEVLFHGHGGDADGYLSRLGYTRSNNSGYFLVITAFQNDTLRTMQKLVEDYLVEDYLVETEQATAAAVEKKLTSQEALQINGDYARVTQRFPRPGGRDGTPSMTVYSTAGQIYSRVKNQKPRQLLPVSAELYRRPADNRPTLFIGKAADGHFYFQEGSNNFRKLP